MVPKRVRPYVRAISAPVTQLVCLRCHRCVDWQSYEVCCWWPNGCTATATSEQLPEVCWDCCSEDERLDLVDAGCVRAIVELRSRREQ